MIRWTTDALATTIVTFAVFSAVASSPSQAAMNSLSPSAETASAAALPNVPSIMSPRSGIATQTNVLPFSGTGDAKTSVQIFDGATQIGVATVSSGGNWYFANPTPFLDGVHVFTAIEVAAGGQKSQPSAKMTVTVKPSISAFSPLTDQWSHPISVSGLNYYVENANVGGVAPLAITSPDTHTLRFQLNPGDLWPDNDSHRSEIGGATSYTPAETVHTSYDFMLEAGPANQYWTVLGQFHSADGSSITQSMNPDYPVFAVELTGKGGHGQGDYLAIWADYASPGATTPTEISAPGASSGWLFTSPSPLVRGVYNKVSIEARFSNTTAGFLEVWLNGSQIVDYHGPIGYGASNYWKNGVYQDSADTNQTISVDYRNLVVGDTPAPPVIKHGSSAGSVVSLSGAGQANGALTIFDGATQIATASIKSDRTWSTNVPATVGSHSFSAKVTDSAGNLSSASNVLQMSITSQSAIVGKN